MSAYNILNKFQRKALIKSVSGFNIEHIFYTLGNRNLETYVLLYTYQDNLFTHLISPKFLQLGSEHDMKSLVLKVEERLNSDISIIDGVFFKDDVFNKLSPGIQAEKTYDAISYFLNGYYFSGLLNYDPFELSEDIKDKISRYLDVGLRPFDIYKYFLSDSLNHSDATLKKIKAHAH